MSGYELRAMRTNSSVVVLNETSECRLSFDDMMNNSCGCASIWSPQLSDDKSAQKFIEATEKFVSVISQTSKRNGITLDCFC